MKLRMVLLGLLALSAVRLLGDPPPTTVPSAPKFTLTWVDNSTNETGFEVEVSLDGTAFTRLNYVDANVATFQHSGLAWGKQYWYRVRAYNSAGFSTYSNVATGTTPTQPATPNAPSALAATVTVEIQAP